MKRYALLFLVILLCFSCEKRNADLTLIELDKDTIQLMVNEQAAVSIGKYHPEKPKDLTIEWFSSDTTRVIIDNTGTLTAKAPGTAGVYAIANGIKSFSCIVRIKGVFDADYDVYIAGNDSKNLLYWKNGIPVAVAQSTNLLRGKAISVVGDKVIIAAEDINIQGHSTAKYWANGKEYTLSSRTSGVNDMAVLNGDIYIAGYEVDPSGLYIATLWKNGVPTYLDSGGEYSTATAIAVSNSDIYVTGYKTEHNKGFEAAKYWKNGVENEITRSITARAEDIFISSNRIYPAVNVSRENELIGSYISDNGNPVRLVTGKGTAVARSLTVAGNDVFVAGYVYEKETGHRYATLWVNGAEKRLSEHPLYGEACEIASFNSDIYVLANEKQKDYTGPKYWKNGKETNFVLNLNAAEAWDIVVVPKVK